MVKEYFKNCFIYLQTVTVLALFAHHVQHGVHEFGALRVMALGPVVSGARLTEHKVVRPEERTVRSGTNGLHGTGFQVE